MLIIALRKVSSGYLSPMQRLHMRGESELGVQRCKGEVGKERKCRSLYSLFSFPAFYMLFHYFHSPASELPGKGQGSPTEAAAVEREITICKLKLLICNSVI